MIINNEQEVLEELSYFLEGKAEKKEEIYELAIEIINSINCRE